MGKIQQQAPSKTYTVRSDLPITSLSSFNFYITDNVIKSSLHNLDQDADRKEKATRKKENYYTYGDYNNKNAGVAKDETLGGIREEENKETDSNYDDEEIEAYGEETLSHERLNQIKFIDFEPEVLNRVFRVSVLINDSGTDYLDEVFSEMNKTSKFHLKNLTFLRTYRGLPKDINQYRLGSYVWQVIEEIWVLIVLSIVLIFVIFTIMILNRFCKVRKKQKLKYLGQHYIVNRSAQTDPVLTNYIFGASTPYIVSKQMNYIGINNSAGSGDNNEASMLNVDENDDDECFVNI
ncbi:hypothetical protein HELRODRAFT_182630 [Helobdella robusta]|uniref:Uncharacterized protein n=1 Tax=Helobdella robusta TaxID=6412 RepID=T1FII2_HELRO|nr:hypothetical protein HELRODRAFT_182630 [Helobdella robusta]ESN90799.1 hypothetical protein HELRODRAFT_182630 [Helobdella robusta]